MFLFLKNLALNVKLKHPLIHDIKNVFDKRIFSFVLKIPDIEHRPFQIGQFSEIFRDDLMIFRILRGQQFHIGFPAGKIPCDAHRLERDRLRIK